MAEMPYLPRFRTLCSVHHALDSDGGGFTAANAERGDAALEIVGFHGVQQCHDQPRAGGADGMAERAGAAIDVEFFSGDTEVFLRGHRNHGKGLVDLKEIDIADAPADLV